MINHDPSLTQKSLNNRPVPWLVEESIRQGYGQLSKQGALCVNTGKYTGRSPNDKFIVEEETTRNQICWGEVNRPIHASKFEQLHSRMVAYLKDRLVYQFDGFAGADPKFRLAVRFINELPWQNFFARQLFIRPEREELAAWKPEFTVICAPGVQAQPDTDGTRSEAFIILNFQKKLVLIGGTHYAGEIKKSIFSVMNFLMPQVGVFPMHCAANVGERGDVALLFGLSGTGKTTLSADPQRQLIGDDEHGWSENGIFNFEGGCYAKCIKLNRENEPQIWEAIRFGAILENVALDDDTRTVDFESSRYTENTRAAYPVDYIPGARVPGVGGHPSVILFLTADAFGVLPPIARLSHEQALFYFLNGYTSKLAGTERGVTEPRTTFSTCFGSPFLPLHPWRYAEMLQQLIKRHATRVYLVNTGWTGGGYGTGRRIEIKYTRALVRAALEGELEKAGFRTDPVFNLEVPRKSAAVPAEILDPRSTWKSEKEFELAAGKLAGQFTANFEKYRQAGAPGASPLAGERDRGA